MIVSCPNCSAQFMIDGLALGPAGRSVRCGVCHHSWLQTPERSAPEAERAAAANAVVMAHSGAGAGQAADVALREPEAEAPPPPPPRPRVTSRREDEVRPPRRAFGRVLAWFLFVFVVAALVLGGLRYRQEIVQIWPPATRVYQLLGLSVDPPSGYWLRVPRESIKFRRESEGGVPILVVSGEILNQSDKPQRVAPMRILLLDKDDRVLRTERVKIEDRTLDPGKKLPFQTSIPNSPPAAVSVRITFDVTG